jgi:bis(5'-nucleosyl)-tetraphosphatase (symmetrical)
LPTYAIGDVQGCYVPLMRLLEKIQFDPEKDILWFTGDLVNRGPQSFEVVEFVRNLGSRAITVLGNHDLHFLATGAFKDPVQREWMQNLPFIHYDAEKEFLLVHAGIPPQWDIPKALSCAREVERALQVDAEAFFANMYGDSPTFWDESLTGYARLRTITNYLTRMRCLDESGGLELNYKGPVDTVPEGYYPWFKFYRQNTKIIFGHWAALEGKVDKPNVYGVDTGCCWGNCLTAMRLEDLMVYQVNCGN